MHLHAVTIVVDDYDDAIAHYVGQWGFTLLEDTPLSPEKRWVRVSPDSAGGSCLILARAAAESQRSAIGNQTGGRVAFFLHVQDFEVYYQRLVAAGVSIVQGPRREVYGTVAVFRDRFGNLWDVIQPEV